MTAILKAGDLLPSELTGIIASVLPRHTERLRIWVEAPDGWALADWRGLAGRLSWCGAGRPPVDEPAVEVVARSSSGRLFAPSGELKWRVLPVLGERCCRAVFLGNDNWFAHGPCPEAFRGRGELKELPPQNPARTHALLWGQLTGRTRAGRDEQTLDEWIELRIPHRSHYPVDLPAAPANRVGVKAMLEIWSDARGEPQFVRLCDLESYPEN